MYLLNLQNSKDLIKQNKSPNTVYGSSSSTNILNVAILIIKKGINEIIAIKDSYEYR